MISPWKVATKAITSQTWKECSTSCRLISWRWTQSSPSWGSQWKIPWICRYIQRNSPDPEKISVVQEIQPQRNLKELRGLQGRLAYIRRFISNLSWRCHLFSRLTTGVSFIWDNTCQEAFEEIKKYLTHSPVLVAPVLGKPFLLYVRAMNHSLGALVAQNNDQNQEHAIYYLLFKYNND